MYVDDIIITGSNSLIIQQVITDIQSTFSLKDLRELNYFIGIQVAKNASGLHLSQSKYIADLLGKVNMQDCTHCSTSMASGVPFTKNDSELFPNPSLYISIVGALQYVILTRPEIVRLLFLLTSLANFFMPLLSIIGKHVREFSDISRELFSVIFSFILMAPYRLITLVMLIGLETWMMENQLQVIVCFLVQIWYLGVQKSSLQSQDPALNLNMEFWPQQQQRSYGSGLYCMNLVLLFPLFPLFGVIIRVL